MDEFNFISVIDYIGEINDGVAILLSMKIIDNIYEICFWFNEENNYILSADNKFSTDFKVNTIYEYKYYKKLAYYIYTFVLDNKDEIIKEFLYK